MNVVIQQAIQLLGGLILGSDVFTRIQGAVDRWADKEIAGAEKRAGVLAELEVIGLQLAKWEANLGIELATAFVKKRTSA